MTGLAAGVLSLGALIGLVMAWRHLQKRSVPGGLALGHAAVGLVGVGLLSVAALEAGSAYRLTTALICLVFALIGGGFILIFRLEGDRAPGFMIALHALAAVSGLILVWLGVLAA